MEFNLSELLADTQVIATEQIGNLHFHRLPPETQAQIDRIEAMLLKLTSEPS